MSTYSTIKKYADLIGDNEFMRKLLPDIDFEEMGCNPSDKKDETSTYGQTPDFIKHELRDYQLEGLNWLIGMHEKGVNCILADEMGLGKTLQSISLLGYLKVVKNIRKKHLVIVPKSCLQNWADEFKRFVPVLNVKVFHASRNEIRQIGTELLSKKIDVIITTYEMCIYAKRVLRKIDWYYVVIDEAHRLKNENSKLSQMIRLYSFRHRLLLTGTPLQNNIHELWALLNFIVPEVFSDSERFENYVLSAGQEERSIESLRNILQLFFLRREKLDVEHSLKPKRTVNVYCPLSEMQRTWYKSILRKDLRSVTGCGSTRNSLLNVVMQLRKCCNHPYLFEGAEPTPFETGEHLVTNSGKMVVLDKLLKHLYAKGSRVLVFSQMTMMVDILEDYINFRGWEYARIDGKTSVNERTTAINEFNAPGSDKFVFLLTTRAGGLGINLYTADSVVIFDSDWNPQADLQAQDRAHRIGQKNEVSVFRLVTENTVEEGIVLRAQRKLKLDDLLMQGDKKKANNASSQGDRKKNTAAPSQDELMAILSSGLDPERSGEISLDLKIEEILRRGEEKTREMNAKLDSFRIGDGENGRIDLYEWEGENYFRRKVDEYVEQDISTRPSRNTLFTKRTFKKLIFPDYQFYPRRFYELQDREEELFNKNERLSNEEQREKEELFAQGFNWTKKDYKTFINAVEQYDKDIESVRARIPWRDDLDRYFNVFWERIHELADADKILSNIEKNKAKTEKKKRLKQIFRDHPTEIDDCILSKNRLYIDNSYLLRLYVDNIEYENCFERIKQAILENDDFIFDYFLLSRTTTEISKHINVLTSQILKAFPEKKDI